MPMRSARFPFEEEFIAAVVPAEGVYALWDGNTVIFYGVADEPGGLRGSLRTHRQEQGPACTKHASHFQVEPASRLMTLRERQDELLREHLRANRSYPRCNLPNRLLALGEPIPLRRSW
jgi:hypothetical protein